MSQNETRRNISEIYFSALILFSCLILLKTTTVEAAKSCKAVFGKTYFEKALSGEKIDNFELLQEFENVYNREEFSRPIQKVEIPYVAIKKSDLTINLLGSDSQNDELLKLLETNKGSRLWFQHPFNDGSHVPYFRMQPTGSMEAYLSASRSIFFTLKNKYYSIKMPTTRPRSSSGIGDIKKTNIAPEIQLALRAMQSINTIDKYFMPPAKVYLAKEVGVVQRARPAKESSVQFVQSGYMIRSLDFLENRNRYYMPAFSLGEIVKNKIFLKNKNAQEYIIKNYVEALAKAKAQLLIHYGLQMDFPHGQNILLEFDENFNPTGKFIFRDIDDMSQYKPTQTAINQVLQRLGQKPLLQSQDNITDFIRLHWSDHSSKTILKSSNKDFSFNQIVIQWEPIHTKAFIQEIARLLGVRARQIGSTTADVDIFLSCAWGQTLVQDYFLKLVK